MRATVRNMRRCETAGIRAEMFDLVTRESYSATSGDYFWQDDDTPFSGCVLVTRTPAQLADIAEADLA